MWHGVTWLITALLMALWSLFAWGLHAVTQWAAAVAGASGAAAAGGIAGAGGQLATLQAPPWLAPWLPPGLTEQVAALASASAPWVESLLAASPDLAAWLTPVLWIGWAIGALVLLAIAIAISVLLRVGARRLPMGLRA